MRGNGKEKIGIKFVPFIIFQLKILALWSLDGENECGTPSQWEKIYLAILRLGLVAAFATSVAMILYGDVEIFYALYAISTIGLCFIMESIMRISQIRRQSVAHILMDMRNDLSALSAGQCFLAKDFRRHFPAFVRKNIILTVVIGYAVIVLGLEPLAKAILEGDTNNKDYLTLTYPAFYPWILDSWTKYAVSYASQVPFTYTITSVTWANIAFVWSVTFYVELCGRNLIHTLRNYPKDETSTNKYKYLVRCVQSYQSICGTFKQFRSWFNMVFGAQFVYTSIEMSVLFYIIVNGNNSPSKTSKVLIVLVMVAFRTYLYCSIGQQLSEINESVSLALYDLPWYEEGIPLRKFLYVFMTQTKRPLILSAFNTFAACVPTFGVIMRNTYNYVNFLRLSTSSRE